MSHDAEASGPTEHGSRNEPVSVRDIHEPAFLRKELVFQRAGWGLVVLILLGAVAGLFGTGPLSATKSTGDGVSVEYERFIRHKGQAEIVVTLGAAAVADGSATVHVSQNLVDDMRIDDIQPEPASVVSTGDDVSFTFEANADSPPTLTFRYRPEAMGATSGSIRTDAAGTADIWQLAYP